MAAAPLRAQTYGFDTLACGSGAGLGAYQGFTWSGFLCYDATLPNPFPVTSNLAASVVSLKNVIHNRGGSGSYIGRATAFNFSIAWVTSVRNSYPETYRFTGWLGASQVGFVDILTGNTKQLASFNFTNVDKVVLTNISNPGANAGLLMDDVTFDAPTSSVPEPASVLLMASGLAGGGLVARRRRR